MLDAFAMWLADTWISQAIMEPAWVWPVAEIIHFIGLSLVLGVAGTFDLRLLGAFRSLPIRALHRLTRWAAVGFALNVFTGVLFFVGTPAQYIHNTAFYYKLAFIAFAGLNALVFELLLSRRILAIEPGASMPAAARVVGATSLAGWLMVLYWGRMLAFWGDAF